MIGTKGMRRTVAMSLALAAAMAMAMPTLAACGLTTESVAKAPVVFVGLLTDSSVDGSDATFQVEDIWRGGGLVVGKPVVVDTTNSLQRLELPPSGVPPSSYLVLANTVGGQLHTGDSCEIFPFPWDASYAAFRPADAPPPGESEGQSGGGIPAAVIGVAAAAVLLIAIGFVAFRRGAPA